MLADPDAAEAERHESRRTKARGAGRRHRAGTAAGPARARARRAAAARARLGARPCWKPSSRSSRASRGPWRDTASGWTQLADELRRAPTGRADIATGWHGRRRARGGEGWPARAGGAADPSVLLRAQEELRTRHRPPDARRTGAEPGQHRAPGGDRPAPRSPRRSSAGARELTELRAMVQHALEATKDVHLRRPADGPRRPGPGAHAAPRRVRPRATGGRASRLRFAGR